MSEKIDVNELSISDIQGMCEIVMGNESHDMLLENPFIFFVENKIKKIEYDWKHDSWIAETRSGHEYKHEDLELCVIYCVLEEQLDTKIDDFHE